MEAALPGERKQEASIDQPGNKAAIRISGFPQLCPGIFSSGSTPASLCFSPNFCLLTVSTSSSTCAWPRVLRHVSFSHLLCYNLVLSVSSKSKNLIGATNLLGSTPLWRDLLRFLVSLLNSHSY